jgi:hypothetical protein
MVWLAQLTSQPSDIHNSGSLNQAAKVAFGLARVLEKQKRSLVIEEEWRGRRDSNPRPLP